VMTNRPWAKRSRWITGIAICASAVGLAALLGAAMTPPPTPAAATAVLQPTDQENYVARRVADIVAREHYRRAPLDDHLSSLILDRYLDALDGGRSYFMQAMSPSSSATATNSTTPSRRATWSRRSRFSTAISNAAASA